MRRRGYCRTACTGHARQERCSRLGNSTNIVGIVQLRERVYARCGTGEGRDGARAGERKSGGAGEAEHCKRVQCRSPVNAPLVEFVVEVVVEGEAGR